MFQIGDKVKVGLFEGKIVSFFDYGGKKWAKVEMYGHSTDYELSELTKIKINEEEK